MKKRELNLLEFYDQGFDGQPKGKYFLTDVKELHISVKGRGELQGILSGKDNLGYFLALTFESEEFGWESFEKRARDQKSIDRFIEKVISTKKVNLKGF